MIQEEQQRFAAQGNKAINIFAMTLGKNQRVKPELNLGIDEASAVHLTYIWSELRMLGQDPRLWFSTLRQDRGRKKPKAEEAAEPAGPTPAAARRRARPGLQRPGDARRPGGGAAAASEAFGDEANEIRIACIDIGGGTTDLMIAKYNFESKIDDSIRGQVLHQDGISLGGDQLVKRLLEVIIVPALRRRPGPGRRRRATALRTRGAAEPRNPRQRVNFINRLFVPLAQAYLNNASDDVTDPISHTDPEIVDPGGRRVAAEGLRQAPRAGLLQRPAGTRPGLRPQPVRGRRLRRLRRAALRLLPAHRRARGRRGRCWPGCPRSSATSSSW